MPGCYPVNQRRLKYLGKLLQAIFLCEEGYGGQIWRTEIINVPHFVHLAGLSCSLFMWFPPSLPRLWFPPPLHMVVSSMPTAVTSPFFPVTLYSHSELLSRREKCYRDKGIFVNHRDPCVSKCSPCGPLEWDMVSSVHSQLSLSWCSRTMALQRNVSRWFNLKSLWIPRVSFCWAAARVMY